jgi:DNA-binding CsgD family transcriptional regulator
MDGIVLPRALPAPPLHAMAFAVPRSGEFAGFESSGAVLLVIFDPLNAERTPVGWLARQYRLSSAEERLTEAIAGGIPLADAAEQLGIRISTARWRLKVILQKTGCSRQLDLVRLALSAPPISED